LSISITPPCRFRRRTILRAILFSFRDYLFFGFEVSKQEGFEELSGLDEAASFDSHNHIDGIEVFIAAEAPGQVGFGVGGSVEFLTKWA